MLQTATTPTVAPGRRRRKPLTLASLTEEANKAADSAAPQERWTVAAQYLYDRLSDPDVWRQVGEEFLSEVVRGYIANCAYTTNHKTRTQARTESGNGSYTRESTERVRAVAAFSWYNDFTLGGGVKLGEARYSDLTRAIEAREALAAGNMREARFLKRLRKHVDREDKKTIREVLPEREIERMNKDVKNE
jgi:hypothetical protein